MAVQDFPLDILGGCVAILSSLVDFNYSRSRSRSLWMAFSFSLRYNTLLCALHLPFDARIDVCGSRFSFQVRFPGCQHDAVKSFRGSTVSSKSCFSFTREDEVGGNGVRKPRRIIHARCCDIV